MIPSTELRKNNLVIRNGLLVEVGWHSLGFDMVPDEPVEITPEILASYGMKKQTGFNVFVTIDMPGFEIWREGEDGEFYFQNYAKRHSLKYFHQVQNLFFSLYHFELKKRSYIEDYKCG